MFRQMTLGSLVLVAALTATSAWADHDRDRGYGPRWTAHGGSYDYADVVDVDPIVRHVRVRTPVEECWDEVEHYPSEYRAYRAGTAAPTILGGIIGGVIGHQFGSGRGNDAATVAGAVIGSAIAYDAASRQQAGYYEPARSRTVERCHVNYQFHEEERIEGYTVTYEYHGRHYQVRTSHPPGDKIRVRVDVTPAP